MLARLRRTDAVSAHFPNSMLLDDFVHRMEIALYKDGFSADNTIGEPLISSLQSLSYISKCLTKVYSVSSKLTFAAVILQVRVIIDCQMTAEKFQTRCTTTQLSMVGTYSSVLTRGLLQLAWTCAVMRLPTPWRTRCPPFPSPLVPKVSIHSDTLISSSCPTHLHTICSGRPHWILA